MDSLSTNPKVTDPASGSTSSEPLAAATIERDHNNAPQATVLLQYLIANSALPSKVSLGAWKGKYYLGSCADQSVTTVGVIASPGSAVMKMKRSPSGLTS